MITFDDLVTPFTSVPPAVIPPPVVMDDKDSINEQLQDFLSSLSSNWPSEMSKKVYRYVILSFSKDYFAFTVPLEVLKMSILITKMSRFLKLQYKLNLGFEITHEGNCLPFTKKENDE